MPDGAPLTGLVVGRAGADPGVDYAVALLAGLGAGVVADESVGAQTAHAVLDASGRLPDTGTCVVVHSTPYDVGADWARSGAMALTGRSDGPPLPSLGQPATAVRGALLAFELLARARGVVRSCRT